MSDHVERGLAEAYALGALDAAERKLFEAHLGSCRICRESVGGAAVTVNAIGLTAPKEKPPKGSGDRLVALYRDQQGGGAAGDAPPARGGNGGGGLGNTLAAAFAVAALGVGGWGLSERSKAADSEKKAVEAAKQAADSEKKASDFEKKAADLEKKAADHDARMNDLLKRSSDLEDKLTRCHSEKEILAAKDVKYHTKFAPQAGFVGDVQIAHSPTRGVVVLAANLPKPPEGKVYKLWSVKKTASGALDVRPLGAFQPGVVVDKSPGGAEYLFAISLETDPNVLEATKVVLLPG